MAIHAAVFGAIAAAGLLRERESQAEEPIPICFEVIEAADDSAPEETAPAEERDSAAIPEPEEAEDEMAEYAVQPEEPAEPEEPEVPAEPEEPEEQAAPEEPEAPAEPETPETPAQPEANTAPAPEEHAAVVSDPVALNRIVPVYPRSARRKRHEGSVEIEISVEPDGSIGSAEILASSGYGELDAAALDAVRSARFAPAQADGVSVHGRLRLTFSFRLR